MTAVVGQRAMPRASLAAINTYARERSEMTHRRHRRFPSDFCSLLGRGRGDYREKTIFACTLRPPVSFDSPGAEWREGKRNKRRSEQNNNNNTGVDAVGSSVNIETSVSRERKRGYRI